MIRPPEDHWQHKTVQVLAAYASALSVMHEAIRAGWPDGAYLYARAAVRAARMLTLKEEYK